MGSAHPNIVPYQAFATRNGTLMLAVGNDRQFARCCDVLQIPELSQDERYATMRQRLANRASLISRLEECFATRNTDEWLRELRARGVPAGPVNDIGTVLNDDYARERNLIHHMPNGNGDSVPTVANPVTFSTSPVEYHRAPPLLGEHTNEVLREWLGYSDAQIETLRKSEVI
jgi:formyl-CoA transferase